MTRIESKHVEVNCPQEEVYNYLTDLNNFKELLPQDRISNWESNTEMCSFRIQGTVTISIVLKEGKPNGMIHLGSGEKSPFPFTLDVNIIELEANRCEAFQVFEADINPFLKMMVEKPLSNLFDYIADRLAKVKGEAPTA